MYCKLYINSKMSVNDLYEICIELLSGDKEGIRTISTQYLEFDLRKNNEYDIDKLDTFLFWKYYADIEPKDIKREEYVNSIRNLRFNLRDRNIDTIAACDFEDELQ